MVTRARTKVAAVRCRRRCCRCRSRAGFNGGRTELSPREPRRFIHTRYNKYVNWRLSFIFFFFFHLFVGIHHHETTRVLYLNIISSIIRYIYHDNVILLRTKKQESQRFSSLQCACPGNGDYYYVSRTVTLCVAPRSEYINIQLLPSN